jgi:hypothetical protein
MRDTQPPITNDEEYAGYKHALGLLNDECSLREQAVFDSRNDADKLERARNALYRMYGKRQGIINAIKEYEKQQQQSA